MKTKKCKICGEIKELKDFAPSSVRKKKCLEDISRNQCRACCNKARQKAYIKRVETSIMANIKARVRKEHLEFNLTYEDIIIPEKCPILEVPLIRGTKKNYAFTPTADRIDNTKGYIKGNIKIISMLANKMKNNATKEQLFIFAKNIQKYLEDDIV